MAKAAPIEGLSADSPLAWAARQAIAVRLAELRGFADAAERRCVLGQPSETGSEAIHDLRVATRRLRAALTFANDPTTSEARAELGRLGRALGAVRDLDVQLAWLDEALASGSLTSIERAGIERFRTEQEAALEPRERALAPILARFTEAVAPRLERGLAKVEARGRLGGQRLRRRLRRRIAKLGERTKRARASSDPHTAHQLRKAVKKLRYQVELAEPARPSPLGRLLSLLVPLQHLLGELHDRDVRLPLLERALVSADPAEQPGLIALLRRELDARERLAGELTALLSHWHDERIIRTLRRELL